MAFNDQEKIMSFRVEHIGHVAMASPGTGFVYGDPSHVRPRVLDMGRFNVMGRHAPEPGVVLPRVSATAVIAISRHKSIAVLQKEG